MVKNPEEFKIPQKYKYEIKRIYNQINKKLKNEILFFMVTGSCARETVIDGWSDIDFIIVSKFNNHFLRTALKEIFSISPIKIGYTIYSKKIFENNNIDFKTAFALYEMQNKRYYVPCILSENIKIPYIEKNDLKQYAKIQLFPLTHTIMRVVYDFQTNSASKIFKEIIHIMRIILFIKDINPRGYDDVTEKFFKLTNFKKLNIKRFISFKKFDYISEYAQYFLDYLYNNNYLLK